MGGGAGVVADTVRLLFTAGVALSFVWDGAGVGIVAMHCLAFGSVGVGGGAAVGAFVGADGVGGGAAVGAFVGADGGGGGAAVGAFVGADVTPCALSMLLMDAGACNERSPLPLAR